MFFVLIIVVGLTEGVSKMSTDIIVSDYNKTALFMEEEMMTIIEYN